MTTTAETESTPCETEARRRIANMTPAQRRDAEQLARLVLVHCETNGATPEDLATAALLLTPGPR